MSSQEQTTLCPLTLVPFLKYPIDTCRWAHRAQIEDPDPRRAQLFKGKSAGSTFPALPPPSVDRFSIPTVRAGPTPASG